MMMSLVIFGKPEADAGSRASEKAKKDEPPPKRRKPKKDRKKNNKSKTLILSQKKQSVTKNDMCNFLTHMKGGASSGQLIQGQAAAWADYKTLPGVPERKTNSNKQRSKQTSKPTKESHSCDQISSKHDDLQIPP